MIKDKKGKRKIRYVCCHYLKYLFVEQKNCMLCIVNYSQIEKQIWFLQCLGFPSLLLPRSSG